MSTGRGPGTSPGLIPGPNLVQAQRPDLGLGPGERRGAQDRVPRQRLVAQREAERLVEDVAEVLDPGGGDSGLAPGEPLDRPVANCPRAQLAKNSRTWARRSSRWVSVLLVQAVSELGQDRRESGFLPDEPRDPLDVSWRHLLGRPPDDALVDEAVLMGNDVAHALHLSPGNFRVPLRELVREA